MSLAVKTPNSWSLQDDLNFTNVTAIEKEIRSTFKDVILNLNIDLGNIKEIDSAGISLLLSIIHHCQSKNIQLQFLNLSSKNAQELIAIHGLSDIFTQFLTSNCNHQIREKSL